ncbi:hypothetical protein AHAS_Ahas06G0176400 [Arachis hypogaea]
MISTTDLGQHTLEQGGYDYIMGTSEHGQIIKSHELKIPSFRLLLIAFGGLTRLEESIEDDDNLKVLFNYYFVHCYHCAYS